MKITKDSSRTVHSEAGPFLLPAVVDSQVRTYGTAYLTSAAGQPASQQLESKTIAVGAAGGSVSWDVELNTPETGIAGVINVNPSSIVTQHYVYAYGQWPTPAQGLYVNTWIRGNGPYSLLGLIPGTYGVQAYSYFQNPYGYLAHGWQPEVTVTSGSVTEKSFLADLGYISDLGQRERLQGHCAHLISYGGMEASLAKGSGWAMRYFEPGGGSYNLAVSPGAWSPYRSWLRFEN